MLDFGAFCYLHVEKTGGTYVSRVLKEISLLPLWKETLHGTIGSSKTTNLIQNITQNRSLKWPARGLLRRNCYYFNSVREPFNYYASLYNYGCDGRGGAAHALKNHGKGYFYDKTETGFLNWVEFLLDSKNAAIWHEEYSKTCARCIGFLTFRFLRLSFSDPFTKLKEIADTSDTNNIYHRYNICRSTLRTENLNQDLLSLLKGPLKEYVDVKAAATLLDKPERVNASVSGAVTGEVLRKSHLASLVMERDAFIFDRFY